MFVLYVHVTNIIYYQQISALVQKVNGTGKMLIFKSVYCSRHTGETILGVTCVLNFYIRLFSVIEFFITVLFYLIYK